MMLSNITIKILMVCSYLLCLYKAKYPLKKVEEEKREQKPLISPMSVIVSAVSIFMTNHNMAIIMLISLSKFSLHLRSPRLSQISSFVGGKQMNYFPLPSPLASH